MSKLIRPKINILQSYYYLLVDGKKEQRILETRAKDINLLLDCGAYTAYTVGVKIKLNDYIRYLRDCPFPIERYFTLDVLGNPLQTSLNYKKMLNCNLQPLPIFTKGTSFNLIDELYDDSSLIALGALQGGGSIKEQGYLKRAMRAVDGRKVHWLGYTNKKILYYYKPYSCDNSNITRGFRQGVIQFYLGHNQWISLTREDIRKKIFSSKIKKLFGVYERDYKEVLKIKNWRGGSSNSLPGTITLRAWVLYAFDIQIKLNIKFYLAFAPHLLQQVIDAYDFWLEKGVIYEDGISLFRRD